MEEIFRQNVFFGPRIQPGEEESMEDLARYIIRASFSQDLDDIIPSIPKPEGPVIF